MPRRFVLGFFLCTALGSQACAPANTSTNAPATQVHTPGGTGGINHPSIGDRDYVVLVSFDGFRRDYLDRHETPHFDELGNSGLVADALIPVFPSQTFSGHYSIATGLYPSRHGIVNNRFFDPLRDERFNYRDTDVVQDGTWYGGEPIWITAERQGMTTASFFFPGTEAPILGLRPSRWRTYDAGVPNRRRVEQVIEWLQLPPGERPHLITVYFSMVDGAGHNFGPEAPQLSRAIGTADRYLGMLMSEIASLAHGDRVNLVVVSDHGMAAVDHARQVVVSEVMDLRRTRLESFGPGVSVHIGGNGRAGEQFASAFNAAVDPDDARAYIRADAPAHLHIGDNPSYGDVLLIPSEGVLVRFRERTSRPTATHGWDPTLPSMHGIFLAAGPTIVAGAQLPAIEHVHVYPFLAHLLGLTPNPDIDGDLAVFDTIVGTSREP